MTLLTTFTYQVRAGANYDEFVGNKTDYDFETAKKVYDENEKNYNKIAITMTPSLCEDEFSELADELNINLKYEVKYILEKKEDNDTKPKDEGISNFDFSITLKFENILETMEEEQKALLDKPSGLTQVLLCSNWRDDKYRQVDFTGTTNEEAIKKILTFYKHKTYRRLIGDHIFFEGFYGADNKISLGS